MSDRCFDLNEISERHPNAAAIDDRGDLVSWFTDVIGPPNGRHQGRAEDLGFLCVATLVNRRPWPEGRLGGGSEAAGPPPALTEIDAAGRRRKMWVKDAPSGAGPWDGGLHRRRRCLYSGRPTLRPALARLPVT